MKRKICVITGTRADYGILYPVLKAVKDARDLELQIIATGMHLMKEFGLTVNEIKRDGFTVSKRINISYKKDTGEAMATSVGKAVSLFSKSLKELKPDILVVLGDRGEVLAAAIAANYLNIPIAHIHGGEVSGHVDGVLRHAITKLAHIHFPATDKAKERIQKLGEEPWRVKVVGAPALDRILSNHVMPKKRLIAKYGLNRAQPLALLVQHPVHSQLQEASQQIIDSLKAITALKLQTIVIYPNADAGGRAMIKALQRFKTNPYLKHFKSIPHQDYLGLLKMASVLIGNSSSGIIEASSFKLPVVNIGHRQNGRERSFNVLDVAHNKEGIARGITRAIKSKDFKNRLKSLKNPYGDGRAAARIVRVLKTVKLNNRLLEKKITY